MYADLRGALHVVLAQVVLVHAHLPDQTSLAQVVGQSAQLQAGISNNEESNQIRLDVIVWTGT